MNVRTRKLVIGIILVAGLTACSDAGDPADNENARRCVAAGHEIKEHSQFGGKYSKSTYWCEDSDHQIIDLWFEDGDDYRSSEE